MRTIVLDFNDFENARAAHEFLAQHLDFPDYYGHNLDALFDVLSTERRDTNVLILHKDAAFAKGFLAVFRAAAAENTHFTYAVNAVDKS